MDKRFYVSLEAARLLKEKGYNEECDCVIDDDGDIFEHQYQMNQDLPEWKCSCPTKAEAIDWLESKGIVVELRYENDELQKDDSEWEYYIYQYDNEGRLDETVSGWVIGIYDTRLEVEEAAIIRALKEITKK